MRLKYFLTIFSAGGMFQGSPALFFNLQGDFYETFIQRFFRRHKHF